MSLTSPQASPQYLRIVLWDGKWVNVAPKVLESWTPGVMKAVGVFETMRAHEEKVLFLEYHLQRLSRGLKTLGLHWPASWRNIQVQVREVLRRNRIQEARVRLTVWREGLKIRSTVVCQPIGQSYEQGWRAIVSPLRHCRKIMPPIKSLDYSLFYRAYKKAASGWDEAILLNSRGELIEGSRTNIFFVRQDIVCTPPVRVGCLNGVARQVVMRCARALHIRCLTRPARLRDLLTADEAFLSNAIGTVIPLTYVGTRPIGNGQPGSVTQKLRLAYSDFAKT